MDFSMDHLNNDVPASPSQSNKVGRLIFASNKIDVIVSELDFV